MKELEIRCLCPHILISDMGMRLESGQVEYVDVSLANTSRDLTIARRAGAVMVREVQRSRELRPPSRDVARPRPRHRGKPEYQAKAGSPSHNSVELRVLERIQESLTSVVKSDQSELTLDWDRLRDVVREEVVTAVGEALRNISFTSPVGSNTSPKSNGIDMPFIPKKIIESTEARVVVESSSAESDALDQATEALKGKKPKKTKKTKKTKKENRRVKED